MVPSPAPSPWPQVSGVNRIVWAWDTTDTVRYHSTNRGSGTAIFYGDAADGQLPAHDGMWVYHINGYTIPEQVTTYACESFTFPTDQDRHVVALRPINVSKYNHHAILHVCLDNDYFARHDSPELCSYHPQTEPNPSNGQGSSPLGNIGVGCSGLMWSWAVGMGDFIFPDEAGLRIGATAISNVILEIHYDNPGEDAGVKDFMGFEAYYVNTPRANDAAMMIIGDPTVTVGGSPTKWTDAPYTSGDLTAGVAEHHRQATCPGECTKDFETTINVFAQFYHMHNYGSRMFTEKYATAAAGGANLGVVGGRIDFWDNGYQQALATDYTVAPGETL